MEYVVKKVSKGISYYCFQYQRFTKSLGVSMPKNLKAQMLAFFQIIGSRKFELLSQETKSQFPYGDLHALEEFHYVYVCLNHELFALELQDFMLWFSILFTFNSNRSEGSKVTRPQIEQFAFASISRPKTKTDREIFNSFRALRYALSPKMKWNLKHIKQIHALLLDEIDPLISGKWKTENNVAPGDQYTASFQDVQEYMKELIVWLKQSFKKKVYPPLLALQFYCRFERIHPFLDGNGRVGRILINAILNKYHYMPVIFFGNNHKEHCAAIAQAIEGRTRKLHKHFLEQAQKTYRELKKTFYVS